MKASLIHVPGYPTILEVVIGDHVMGSLLLYVKDGVESSVELKMFWGEMASRTFNAWDFLEISHNPLLSASKKFEIGLVKLIAEAFREVDLIWVEEASGVAISEKQLPRSIFA